MIRTKTKNGLEKTRKDAIIKKTEQDKVSKQNLLEVSRCVVLLLLAFACCVFCWSFVLLILLPRSATSVDVQYCHFGSIASQFVRASAPNPPPTAGSLTEAA